MAQEAAQEPNLSEHDRQVRQDEAMLANSAPKMANFRPHVTGCLCQKPRKIRWFCQGCFQKPRILRDFIKEYATKAETTGNR